MIRGDDHPLTPKCQEIDNGTLILLKDRAYMALGKIAFVSLLGAGSFPGDWRCYIPVWDLKLQKSTTLEAMSGASPWEAQYFWCDYYLVNLEAKVLPMDSPELDSYEDSDNI